MLAFPFSIKLRNKLCFKELLPADLFTNRFCDINQSNNEITHQYQQCIKEPHQRIRYDRISIKALYILI